MTPHEPGGLFSDGEDNENIQIRSESDADADYFDVYESDQEPEVDPFDEVGRAAQEENEPQYDEKRRENPDSPLSEKCEAVKKILTYIKSQKVGGKSMTLGSFLEALSWGDADCAADPQVRGHRSAFLGSEEFRRVLRIWRKPPRSTRSHRARPVGGRPILDAFVLEAMLEKASEELESLDPLLRSTADLLTKADLSRIHLDELQAAMRRRAPTLWAFLDLTAYTEKQRARNKHKDPSNVIVLIIAQLLYSRTHYCNRLQRVFSIYFKFKGLSAKGCDTLHALGITMSSKWTTDAVAKLSDEAIKEVIALLKIYPRVISHDNLQMSFRVFSQRLDHEPEFGSGTAATVYVKKNSPLKNPALNAELQRFRAAGMANPLTALDIVELAEKSMPQIRSHAVDHILHILLDSVEFDLRSYEFKGDESLAPPPPASLIPCGPDSITCQYMLGTLPIPEASYEDNYRVITKLLEQLGVRSKAAKKELGQKDIVYYIGDQLTADRIRGLQRFLCREMNAYERLAFIVVNFGWLHLQMAFAKSIHKQYLGTEAGLGLLKHAFTILNRRGLDKASTKGPFHDNLERALYHVLEAHVRTMWLSITGVAKLEDLRGRDPQSLRDYAARIEREFTSTAAISALSPTATSAGDVVKQQAAMFVRDTLLYVVLDKAIKQGDVGLMEGMLPHLVLRFTGGKNSHYVTECLEVLQGLHREWPPEVSDFVRNNCWLVNTTGKRDGNTPIDRAQEARIKDIKVTNRSQGPQIDWDYLHKLHPALPVIQAISHHVEAEFRTWTRYGRHTDPKDYAGVLELQKKYISEELYKTKPGRNVKSESDRVKDFYNEGLRNLGRPIQRWVNGRTFERSEEENWESVSESDSGNEADYERDSSSSEDGEDSDD